VYPQFETLLTYPTLAIAPFVWGHPIAPQELRMICYDHQPMTCINGLKCGTPLSRIKPILDNDVMGTGLKNELVKAARLNQLLLKFT
jgi:hypothetical protein